MHRHPLRLRAAAGLLALAALAALAPSARAADDAGTDPGTGGSFQFAGTPGVTKLDSATWWPIAMQWSAGWRVNRQLAIEAFIAAPFTVEAGYGDGPEREQFERTYGLRAVGYLPIAPKWDLLGGLGVADTLRYPLNHPDVHHHTTEAAVTMGVNYRAGVHYSIGLEATVLATTGTPLIGLRNEFRF